MPVGKQDVLLFFLVLTMMHKLYATKVGQGKITIIIEKNEDEFTSSINNQLSFDLIFPHSK
jgi:hypothetical protein